jgi:hypothetical protein
LLGLHSQIVQAVCQEYVIRRRQRRPSSRGGLPRQLRGRGRLRLGVCLQNRKPTIGL